MNTGGTLYLELLERSRDNARSLGIFVDLLDSISSDQELILDSTIVCSSGIPSTLLCSACDYGDIYAVEVLLQYGASVDKSREDGMFPLLLSLEKKDTKMITLLCKYGSNPLLVSAKSDLCGYDMIQEDMRQQEASSIRKGEFQINTDSVLLQAVCFGLGSSLHQYKLFIYQTLCECMNTDKKYMIDTCAYFITQYMQPNFLENNVTEIRAYQKTLISLYKTHGNSDTEELNSVERLGRETLFSYIGEQEDDTLGFFSLNMLTSQDDDTIPAIDMNDTTNDNTNNNTNAKELMHSMYNNILSLAKSVLPSTPLANTTNITCDKEYVPLLYGSVGFDYEVYYRKLAQEDETNTNTWLHNLTQGLEPEQSVEEEQFTNLYQNEEEELVQQRQVLAELEKYTQDVNSDNDDNDQNKEESDEDWMTPQVCIEDGGFHKPKYTQVQTTKTTGSSAEDLTIRVQETVSQVQAQPNSLWARMENGDYQDEEE